MAGPSRVRVDVADFKQRSDRYSYLVREFSRFLTGSVLDIGCDKAVLKSMIPMASYTGVDIRGNPDFLLNLEKIERLPFDDGSFECVVCLEVLEHLDNLHFIFGELVRISKRHLIVSLPNNWSNARRPIENGRGSIGHYGLPEHPLADRHKWFFGLSDALAFAKSREKNYPLTIIETRVTEKSRSLWIRGLRRLACGSRERYLNRFAQTLWTVYEKTAALN
jgi:SAM-dependent methyltransferase